MKYNDKVRIITIFIISLLLSPAFAHEDNGTDIQVETLVKSTKSWDGSLLPEYSKGQPEVTILKITVAPGVKLPWHQHPVINAGVLVKGELTVTTKSGEKLHMKAGDSIIEVVDKWHYGESGSKEAAEIIVFYAGIVNQPVTQKQ